MVHAQDAEVPTELIEVEKVNYQRNSRASFCMRPIEMVDTIVFHHSQGASTDTPEDINNMHLNRGTPDDPWYMIAYSFVVNSPYPKQKVPDPKVSEGRPLDIVGAHAGSFVYVDMDDEQKRMWTEGKIICGKEGGKFSIDPKQLDSKGRIKANVTTIGVVVNGNYAKFSRDNPTGWTTKNPRFPTDTTLDLLARISCQLQKKYPRMTKLRWHNFYHSTDCPGNIKDYVDQIRTLAKGFGCEFN
jgi:hypothetical protein